MRYAIFDYDNTLSEGYSKYALGYALEDRGIIKKGFRSEIDELENAYSEGGFDYNEKFMMDKKIFSKYFEGVKRTDITRFLKDDLDLAELQYPWAKGLISKLHEKGFIVVVVSGCWDFIIEEAQEILDFDTFFASEFIVKENKLTNEFGRLIDNKTKRNVTVTLLQDAELSIGLGDSLADFEILDRVDHPFLVDNNKEAVLASKPQYTIVNKKNAGEEIEKFLETLGK